MKFETELDASIDRVRRSQKLQREWAGVEPDNAPEVGAFYNESERRQRILAGLAKQDDVIDDPYER